MAATILIVSSPGGQLILHSPVMLTEEDFSVNLINDKLNFLCHNYIFLITFHAFCSQK